MGKGDKSGMERRMIPSEENGMNEWMDGWMDGWMGIHGSRVPDYARNAEKKRSIDG